MRLAWFTRWSAATLAVLALAIPVLAFAEAWHTDHPLWQVVVKGRWDAPSVVLLVLCGLALVPIASAVVLKDYEFLFGATTVAVSLIAVFAVLTSLMPWIRFSPDAGARWFGLLLVICLLALTMVAFDWLRKSLILASVVTVIALGGFITRAGYNDLRATELQNHATAVATATAEAGRLALQPDADPKTLVATANAARQALVNVIFEVQPPNIPAAVRQAAADVYRNTATRATPSRSIRRCSTTSTSWPPISRRTRPWR